jgi:hypothetical protein
MEVADWLGIMNIENNGENKFLMVKAAKQRDKVTDENSPDISAIRHPFISSDSFALKLDINENVSLSIPIYAGKQTTNFMANI